MKLVHYSEIWVGRHGVHSELRGDPKIFTMVASFPASPQSSFLATTSMYAIFSFLVLFFSSLAHAQPPKPVAKCPCLSDTEANHIATAWLHIWDTGAISALSDLTTIVASNITSYDEAYGGPSIGIEALFEELTLPGNFSTTDVKQFPLFVIHTCDQVVTRWGYTGVTTGYESYVSSILPYAGNRSAESGPGLYQLAHPWSLRAPTFCTSISVRD